VEYFDYSQISNPETDLLEFSIEEFLEESQKQEEERLEKELEQISEQLERRDELHDEALDELESKLDWYIERLEELYQRFSGDLSQKEDLKNRIEEFYREIRLENREWWRDRQQLEKERRTLHQEISEIDDLDLQQLL